MLETLIVIPWEFDWATKNFTYIGPQASQYGYPIAEWYGDDFWMKTIHPDDLEEAAALCQTAVQKGQDYEFEFRLIGADSSICWVKKVVRVVTNKSGATILSGIFVDLTALKQSESINVRLAKIVEDSLNEIYVFDCETLNFLQVNKSACRNTGYTAEEFARLTPVDLKPEFTLEQFENQIAPLRRGEKNHIRFQTTHRRKDGSHYDADIILQQIQSEDRPVFAAIIEDVTERNMAQHELTAHRDRLQEMVDAATAQLKVKAKLLKQALVKEKKFSKLQRQFISTASHEFRTPLAIIDSSAHRLKRRADKLTPEETIKRVDKIQYAVRRMTRLMERALTAARMENGKIALAIAPCQIGVMIREVCKRQQEISPNHVISCEIVDAPETIRVDSGALEQMLTNMLSNAVKYSPDAPDIEVKAFGASDQVVIQVRDHGLGIDEDDLPDMFQRFFRAKTSIGFPGTGIGLHLVKTLVEMHGGKISVESRKSEGSTFTVQLPINGPRKQIVRAA